MAYIGKQPVVGNFVKLDAITTSATTTFNLLNGGVSYFPQTANNCIVSLNGVIQSPTSAYTISGSTIVFSDALTSSDTIDFILVLGDVLSIGTPSDGTITSAKLASGISGLISWQSVQTTGFTAVAARAYPCNTTSSAFTVTLPASPSVGDQVLLLDYAGTFDTNNLTVNPNSNKLEGGTSNLLLSGDREGVTLTYIDSTQGWLATSGIQEGTDALEPTTYSIDFLVIAGGGAGGDAGGGGGAGGYRTSTQTVEKGTVITVTVGDGGTASDGSLSTSGSNSSISGSGLTTITSAGGGNGGNALYPAASPSPGANGGSGGGGGGSGETNPNSTPGGSGNTPSTSPSQGNSGGAGQGVPSQRSGGGGGGASGAGSNSSSGNVGGNGGNGTASSITGSSVTRAGGGGGFNQQPGTNGTGGTGGGGNSGQDSPSVTAGTAGTTNTGSGGGGGSGAASGNGGKGVVILSFPTAKYSSTTTGSPTVTTSGSNTILQFNGSGSYTA
jgi:hypothetical protein